MSPRQKQLNAQKEFDNVFRKLLDNFVKDSEIVQVEESMYGIIIEMARNMSKLILVRRFTLHTKDVNIEYCTRELTRELLNGGMLRVSEQKIRNLEPDFGVRMGSCEGKYLKYREHFSEGVQNEFIESVQGALD